MFFKEILVFSCLIIAAIEGHEQHHDVLANTYEDMYYEGGLTKDYDLERWAQSTSRCKVWDHDHHKENDDLAVGKFGKAAWIISCAESDGCSYSSIVNDPLKVWRNWADRSNHWRRITSGENNYVGCAANKCGSDRVYLWCYLA